MARTVFITGAYGAVGVWVARACLERGDRVVVLRRTPGAPSALALDGLEPRCHVVDGDLLARGVVEAALVEYGVDTVFHLAAAVVGTELRPPEETVATNVGGTAAVLDACRRAEVPRVVVASSVAIHGPGDGAYVASKRAADALALDEGATVARLSNVYGGGDLRMQRLVPSIVEAVLAGRPPVIRSDGTPRLELIYAEDAAAAYLAIADAAGDGQAFDVRGTPHAIHEVVETLIRLAGADVIPEYGPPAAAAPRRSVQGSRLRELPGWQPQVGLEEGLQRTLDWYRAH
ncbi:MAG: NAD(P)-dependent oxidoreductase [Solirubrobacteraceae bacterium]|nr:NAD(P)-dependent oxidoreductase [Solirubrobacteraceae bacterium]